jgi:serine/threonine protein kinase
VFEYASKGSLDNFYESEESRATLSSKIRLRIMSDIICAIHYLHTGTKDNLGLFHRDIKSDNVCLDQNYTAELIDCGLAKFVLVDEFIETNKNFFSVQITSSNGVFGTPGYICPWYSTGNKKFEASCDVYSFGIVMIELVTGCLQNKTELKDFSERYFSPDFEGTPAEALELAIPKLKEDADSEAEWEDGILSSVCSLAIRCIQKNREKRPKTLELIKELGRLARPTDHIE